MNPSALPARKSGDIRSVCMHLFVAGWIFTACSPPVTAAEPTAEEKRQVDDSITRALSFLSRQQQNNGCWKIDAFGESTAATSLSIMAFLAAGHVPGEGPYGKQLERGIRWVLDHQQTNGMLLEKTSHGPMYDHGISTLMLGEVLGMCDRKLADDVRKALERAIKVILSAQNVPKNQQHAGGWRYNHNSTDSDLSVTGWQLLALRAAKSGGCDVPAEQIERAVSYVRNCSRGGRGFGYTPGSGGTPTLTGVGVLALEVCGEHHDDEAVRGGDFLLRSPLQFRDPYFFYGVYYCSVGMFKMGGKYWDDSQAHLRDVLLNNQQADGSWTAGNGGEMAAGRIYCTSMAVLALAVEYQYLPIYQR